MATEDILILFGEVAIALAGFSGVAAALGKPEDPVARMRVRMVVHGVHARVGIIANPRWWGGFDGRRCAG